MIKLFKQISNTEYKIEKVIEELDITTSDCIIGNHSFWFPKLTLKIPFQYKGKITKYIVPMQALYERENNIINELTILTALNILNMSPKIHGLVYIKKFITNCPFNNNVDKNGTYGYIMEDATKLQPINININKFKKLPIKYSKAAYNDLIRDKNNINGYIVDVRRSGQDMYKWLHKSKAKVSFIE